MKIRCSSLPLAFACPGSLRAAEGEVLIDHANEFAALGSAVHEVLAQLVLSTNGDGPDVKACAMKYGVDADELARLVAYGAHAWRAISKYYPEPQTELDLHYEHPAFTLTGHIDLAALLPESANIADWKSGYRQPDYYAQLMGYATLIFANYPDITTVRANTVWLRDWSQDTVLITADDCATWEEELAARVVHWDGTYAAGAHCTYCPRFAGCPARQALVRSALAEIEVTGPVVTPLAMPVLVQMYREGKLQIVKGLLKQIDTMIRDYIEALGPIDLGNGRELALVPENHDKIDALPAWPILTQYLSNEELAPAISIGKTAVLDAIGDKAAKGQKARAKAQLMEELKAAQAVKVQTQKKLRERKIEQEGK